MTKVSNGDYVCDSCLESYTCCEGCSKYFDSDDCEECDADDCQYCCDCMPEPPEQYCQISGDIIQTEDIEETTANQSVYPIILGTHSSPVRGEAIVDLMARIARGDDVSQFPSIAKTALSLCLAGF